MIRSAVKHIHLFLGVIICLLSCTISVQGAEGLSTIKQNGYITVITRNNANCYYTYRNEAMGFEYELAKAFADYIGVKLKVVTPQWGNILASLEQGDGDFIAANMTILPSRGQKIAFSSPYLSVQQRIIVHKDNNSISKLSDINGKTFFVRENTSYEERLRELQKEGYHCTIKTYEDLPTEKILMMVAGKKIPMTVADSNIALLDRCFYPGIKVGISIQDEQKLAWAVRKSDTELLTAINEFFDQIKTNGIFQGIYNEYYGSAKSWNGLQINGFHRAIKTRLPLYGSMIKEFAEKYGFDWRLIAAQVFHESSFNPRAESYCGARGLMQLTERTAKEMGVTDRFDPEQCIMGGVKYLRRLCNTNSKAQGLNRILLALASYNTGYGHIIDAQNIARARGLDPYQWPAIEEILPLLTEEKYADKSRYGYCRGNETVQYVNNILEYYTILMQAGY